MLALPAAAKEASSVASDQTSYIRVLGRLNINTASRAQLEQVPGLDSAKIDAILRVRADAPISDLSGLALSEEAENHLKTEGSSTLYRVRQNPLRRVDQSPASAAR
jgi:DNA uptake protein ComE-like DNA-binding protein